jgi:uncharacterized membrane protein
MKNRFHLVMLFTVIVLFSSCYYDKEELLYPTGALTNCDTVGTISYSAKVVPILQQKCYSCHSVSFPSGNVAMSTYATDKAIAVNGSLYGSINHANGYSPMPKGAAKMTTCEIATIKKWIDAGSPNN